MTSHNLAKAFHWNKFKADVPIIAGATLAMATVFLGVIALHDQWRSLPFLGFSTLAVFAGLAIITLTTREIMRRLDRGKSDLQMSKVGCFAVAFVGCLLLTGVTAKDEVVSGIALQSGRSQLENQQFSAARESFAEYIAIHPKKAAGYYYRALTQFRQGNMDLAYRDLRVAVELQPRDMNSQYLLLGALQKLGRTTEFEAQLKTVERFNPDVRETVRLLVHES